MNSLVRQAAFSPLLTGVILVLLTIGPSNLREPLLSSFKSPRTAEKVILTFKWLFVIGLVSKLNSWLSDVAANNWLWREEKLKWTWSREIAVLTGGSSGIGALTAQGLAKKMKVVVLDVQPLPQHLKDHPNITFYQCDVTSTQQINDTASKIRSELDSPSILINNAGIGISNTILESTPESLRKVFDVNVLSQWHLIRAFLPDMIKARKGHIITIASLASFVGVPHMVDYCATKVALLALHEGLTQELKYIYNCPQVKTSILHPTYAKTPLVQPWEEELRKNSVEIIDPQRIADAIIKQVVSGKGGQIFVPERLWYSAAVRGLPTWLQVAIRDSVAKGHQNCP